MQFLPILALGILMYLLLVRPQQRRVREQRDLVRNVGVGARIQTIGGIVGEVVGADDEMIRVEVSPGVVITFVRAAVGRILQQPDLPDDDSFDDHGEAEDHTPLDDHGPTDEHGEPETHDASEGPDSGPVGGVA